MSELSQNINVRTTHEMKKRIMDEAHKRGMTISECILFSLEDYWNLINKGDSRNDKENANLSVILQKTQDELIEAQMLIEQLTNERNQLNDKFALTTKSVWQGAKETVEGLSQERIEQERGIAVREFIEENFHKLVNTDHEKIQFYKSRIDLYETEVLKKVFQIVKRNPRIKDLPDVVEVLASQYYQQFLSNQKYAQLK